MGDAVETPYAGEQPEARAVRRAGAPLAAGTTRDGGGIVIDPVMPAFLKVKSGRRVDAVKSTAHHEAKERRLMDAGLPYPRAHERAEDYENAKLKEEQGLSSGDVASYQHGVLPFVHRAEHGDTPMSPDLDPRVSGHGRRAYEALSKLAEVSGKQASTPRQGGANKPTSGVMPPIAPKPAVAPAAPPPPPPRPRLPAWLQNPMSQDPTTANTTTGGIARTRDSLSRRAQQFAQEANTAQQQFHQKTAAGSKGAEKPAVKPAPTPAPGAPAAALPPPRLRRLGRTGEGMPVNNVAAPPPVAQAPATPNPAGTGAAKPAALAAPAAPTPQPPAPAQAAPAQPAPPVTAASPAQPAKPGFWPSVATGAQSLAKGFGGQVSKWMAQNPAQPAQAPPAANPTPWRSAKEQAARDRDAAALTTRNAAPAPARAAVARPRDANTLTDDDPIFASDGISARMAAQPKAAPKPAPLQMPPPRQAQALEMPSAQASAADWTAYIAQQRAQPAEPQRAAAVAMKPAAPAATTSYDTAALMNPPNMGKGGIPDFKLPPMAGYDPGAGVKPGQLAAPAPSRQPAVSEPSPGVMAGAFRQPSPQRVAERNQRRVHDAVGQLTSQGLSSYKPDEVPDYQTPAQRLNAWLATRGNR